MEAATRHTTAIPATGWRSSDGRRAHASPATEEAPPGTFTCVATCSSTGAQVTVRVPPVPALTLAHDAVLAVVELLPEGMPASAVLVARAMGISEAAAERLLDELEAAGCLVSAIGRVP